jgi:hypothetical protein
MYHQTEPSEQGNRAEGKLGKGRPEKCLRRASGGISRANWEVLLLHADEVETRETAETPEGELSFNWGRGWTNGFGSAS